MPRPKLPPTPASSTDLLGCEGHHSPSEPSFLLPPPAMTAKAGDSVHDASSSLARASAAATARTATTSPRDDTLDSARPPTVEYTTARRRGSAGRTNRAKDDFALPPPPTRARKIIQMKPASQKATRMDDVAAEPHWSTTSPVTHAGGRAGKTPSTTNAAGRKVARKTAHSLIERRRRSKMNEEFGVLKQMIPACRDQNMHKLAILQASIEYLRYLERCVSDLRANARGTTSIPPSLTQVPSWPDRPPSVDGDQVMQEPDDDGDDDGDNNDDDDGDDDDATPAPTTFQSQPCTPIPGTSSSVSTTGHPSTARSINSTASPIMLPTLPVVRDVDHEVTEALLLLNTDRRGSTAVRGMSVKDLLTL